MVFTSFDVNAFEVPAGRDEAWRFTPLRRLRGLHDGSAVATAPAVVAVHGDVQVETVGRDDARLGQGGVPFDRVAAQAYSSFESATVVTVGRETEVAAPVHIEVTGPGEGEVAFGHLQIRLEEFAKATIVLDQKGSGTYAENVEFVIGDSASLTVVAVQDWADDAVHTAAHHARLGRDSVLRHTSVSLGGDLVRITPTVKYAAPVATPRCSASTSPMPASTSNTGCSWTTRSRTASPTSCTRVRCKVIRSRASRTRTPCGSATC